MRRLEFAEKSVDEAHGLAIVARSEHGLPRCCDALFPIDALELGAIEEALFDPRDNRIEELFTFEAGRRLAARGALADPEHAVDADAAELAALLRGRPGPTAEEVAERFRRRTTRTVDDAPPIIGPPPSPPPPLEALPEPARRATAAINTALANLFQVPDTPNTETVVHGLAVNTGVYEGPARLVADPADFDRVQRQREFVSALLGKATSPLTLINPFRMVPLASAVTDTITVDDGDHIWNLAGLAWGMKGVSGGDGVQTTVPIGNSSGSSLRWDRSRSQDLFGALQQDEPPPPSSFGP